MRVVVAGASGFVGRHVVSALLRRGHTVVGLDRGRRPALPGLERVRCDVGAGEIPAGTLDGADAVVNLIGIKRADGAQTFEAVHVEATRVLLAAARAAGARRFIHVSVVCSRPDAASPYHDTKWRAEQLVRDGGVPATILRPAVIYGEGDDMLTHLVKMIRFAPVFPVVGRGASLLQPVDVRDVAEAVAQALARPETAGRTHDVVGPERLTLATIVRTVAVALGLPLWVIPTPVAVMRPAVALMSRWMRAPLSTPAQLRMLEEGLVGDPGPARRELGLEPQPFDVEAVRAATTTVPPLFGASLRLVSSPDQTAEIAAPRAAFPRAVAVAAAGIALLPLLAPLVGNVWYRMATSGAVLMAASLAIVPLPWRRLFHVTARGVGEGVGAAVALYGLGALVFLLLRRVPGAAPQIQALYAWRDAVPRAVVLPLLVFIIVAEEVVWRLAVTLPFAARLGPVAGLLLAATVSAAAHVSLGIPVLVAAAFGAGAYWSALVVKTRSAVPALVSHVLWDLAVLFAWPYPVLLG